MSNTPTFRVVPAPEDADSSQNAGKERAANEDKMDVTALMRMLHKKRPVSAAQEETAKGKEAEPSARGKLRLNIAPVDTADNSRQAGNPVAKEKEESAKVPKVPKVAPGKDAKKAARRKRDVRETEAAIAAAYAEESAEEASSLPDIPAEISSGPGDVPAADGRPHNLADAAAPGIWAPLGVMAAILAFVGMLYFIDRQATSQWTKQSSVTKQSPAIKPVKQGDGAKQEAGVKSQPAAQEADKRKRDSRSAETSKLAEKDLKKLAPAGGGARKAAQPLKDTTRKETDDEMLKRILSQP